MAQDRKSAAYWQEQYAYALSGLSWAVGRLGDDAGYAGRVHDRLTGATVERDWSPFDGTPEPVA